MFDIIIKVFSRENKDGAPKTAQTAAEPGPEQSPQPQQEPKPAPAPAQRSGDITPEAMEAAFSDCYDFEKRDIAPGGSGQTVKLYFIDGLVSSEAVARQVIQPLTDIFRFGGERSGAELADAMLAGNTFAFTAKLRTELSDAAKDLVSGFCAVVLPDGTAVTFETRAADLKRAIMDPKDEKTVKGSKDAFIEVLKTNTGLVRKKLRNPNIKIKQFTAGERTDTQIALVYIDGYTNAALVAEAEKRLGEIRCGGVLTGSVIREQIVDTPNSPFPQILATERPDRFCINLLEGRVGILVDGLPRGYLVPGTFAQFFKAPEDKANHFIVGSMLTVLRYAALLLTLLLPAFYVAVAMYHQEMLPTKLLQSMIAAKQSVPFPTAFEVLAMLIAFELLQEAGLRLPNSIGETVSILGALIVGQSAVEAKVLSPAVVIVIALAGISGYTVPDQDMGAAIRICRFLLVVAAILGGMFGLAVGVCLLILHLASLESFGVPYLTPFAGGQKTHPLRALVRYPAKSEIDAEPALGTGNGGKA